MILLLTYRIFKFLKHDAYAIIINNLCTLQQDLSLLLLKSEVWLSFNVETLIRTMNCHDMQHHIQI